VATNPTQRVVMRLDRERFVKPSADLKAELAHLLGGDCVQFSGLGTRRKKKQPQQPLFKEAPVDADAPEAAPRQDMMAMEAELGMETIEETE
jgi:hypothetical protein